MQRRSGSARLATNCARARGRVVTSCGDSHVEFFVYFILERRQLVDAPTAVAQQQTTRRRSQCVSQPPPPSSPQLTTAARQSTARPKRARAYRRSWTQKKMANARCPPSTPTPVALRAAASASNYAKVFCKLRAQICSCRGNEAGEKLQKQKYAAQRTAEKSSRPISSISTRLVASPAQLVPQRR